MKTYEITFITREDLKEKPVKEIITTLGGNILSISGIGERNFVYPIKKETKGFYTTVVFELEPDKLIELNKKLTLEEDILRHLLIIGRSVSLEIPEVKMMEVKDKELVSQEKPAQEEIKEEVKEEKVTAEKMQTEEIAKKPVEKVEKAKKEKVIEKPVKKVSEEVTEIEEETESEEDRLKALDKKLDELLKD